MGKKWNSFHSQQKSLKCSTWMQSQEWDNDLCFLPRQTIQYHGNPSLCPNQECWRRWIWTVLWRPIIPSRINTQKRCPFHYRTLQCKSRKSRNTWSNRKIWPWSTEWSKAKANRVLPRECTGHSKQPLPTTQEKTLHTDITRCQYWNQIDYILCSRRCRSSIQSIQRLYTALCRSSIQLYTEALYSENKTGSWMWPRSWTRYCQIQT